MTTLPNGTLDRYMPSAEKDGYNFVGWVDENGEVVNETTIFKKDCTIYAQYARIPHTVTLKTEGGGSATATPAIAAAQTTVNLKATADNGYKFKKWTSSDGVKFKKATSASTTFTMPGKNVTVKAIFEKLSGTPLVTMTSKDKKKLILKWKKVGDANGYDIYFAKGDPSKDKNKIKKVTTIKNNKTTTYTARNLKKNTSYAAYVKAFVWKDSKKKNKIYIGESPVMYAYTSGGNGKKANAGSVSVKKTEVSIKKGNTSKITASVKSSDKKKKTVTYKKLKDIRYLSTDKTIATVSSKGKITAKKKGTCKIYVYAHNGVNKTITVTVK